MKELNEEGGIVARYERYKKNHRTLVDGMRTRFQDLAARYISRV